MEEYHIYVESDREKSVETIIHKIKEFSKNAIFKRFPDAEERVVSGIEIWDEAYFAETTGYLLWEKTRLTYKLLGSYVLLS